MDSKTEDKSTKQIQRQVKKTFKTSYDPGSRSNLEILTQTKQNIFQRVKGWGGYLLNTKIWIVH